MATPPTPPTPPSALAEWRTKVAQGTLRGLSYLFPVPEAHEVTLKVDYRSDRLSGDIDVKTIIDVMERAKAPLQSMYIRVGMVSAAAFFAARALSFLPFVPAFGYLISLATFLVAKDLHAATKEMSFTIAIYNENRMPADAESVAKYIEQRATASVNSLFLFGRDLDSLRFRDYLIAQKGESVNTVDPWKVTQIFFPALEKIEKAKEMALAAVNIEDNK